MLELTISFPPKSSTAAFNATFSQAFTRLTINDIGDITVDDSYSSSMQLIISIG